MAEPEVDICIIGSGAGGGPMALTLAEAGFRVVVLEKGRHYTKRDFVHDEILMSRRNFFTPFPWDEPHPFRHGREAKYERTNHAWTANCVGGGTVHMSALFYRMKPMDFRLRSELGKVEGANLADWPISYAQLEPFYDRAERELGVSGQAVPHPFAEPRAHPYPLPPLKAHPISRVIDEACASLGYRSIPTARGIVSRPYQGRMGCMYCTLCGSYGCEVDAKSGTHVSVLPKALATGRATLRPSCMAFRIEVDRKGRAKSVLYFDEHGRTREQPAKVVVVSCTAVESARLLLQSTSSRFPKGLANGSGLVGKNLLFSAYGGARAAFRVSSRKKRWPWLDEKGPFVLRSVQDFYLMKDARHGFRKGGTLGFLFRHPNPINAAVELAGSGRKGVFGRALEQKLLEYKDTRYLEMETYGEYFPTEGTYVSLVHEAKDAYGLAPAGITVERHPEDFTRTKFLVERGEEIFSAMKPDGIERLTTTGETTILQGGTCRFGKDPATSVLDEDCRAHEVPNLYVVDGSFLPSSGGVPLTLTIAANAFRVGTALAERLKRG